MAYKIIDSRKKHGFDCSQIEVILDTDADLESLGTVDAEGRPYKAGSVALAVNTGNVYMMNASGVWTLFGGEG